MLACLGACTVVPSSPIGFLPTALLACHVHAPVGCANFYLVSVWKFVLFSRSSYNHFSIPIIAAPVIVIVVESVEVYAAFWEGVPKLCGSIY